MEQARKDKFFPRLVGGALCLDFVNTANGHPAVFAPGKQVQPYEALHDYGDLVWWSVHAGAIEAGEAGRLAQQAARQPRRASRVFRQAIALRETLYRIFAPLALGREPDGGNVEQLNQARSRILARSRIITRPPGFRIAWHSDPDGLDAPLIAIVLSAAELLTSDGLGKLRQCAGETCEWLFLDTSRNHLRRWCNMDDCGKRAKSRRQYARVRQLRPDHGGR